MMISLRRMTEADLEDVEGWLRLPHVARWWIPGTTAEAEIVKYRQRVRPGGEPTTHMLMVGLDNRSIGWCQWYQWGDNPVYAERLGARDDEAGIDYAIGDRAQVDRGVGTALIAALVAEVRRFHPGAGILADPDAANIASRRVLEKNGFHLVAVRSADVEADDVSTAIYRLPASAADRAAAHSG